MPSDNCPARTAWDAWDNGPCGDIVVAGTDYCVKHQNRRYERMAALNFNDYQFEAIRTAIYPNRGSNFVYPALGLCGEAGEVAEKIKKIIRDKGGKLDVLAIDGIVKELGDVMWYVAALCCELQVNMEDVARINLEKLAARKAQGTLGGSGDNR